MDYCSSCRRHLNGALVCPGCGAYAPDIAPPRTHAGVTAAPLAADTWFGAGQPAAEPSADLADTATDAPPADVTDAPRAPQGRAARRRQLARWKKNQRRAVVATAVALVGGGLTLASLDRGNGGKAQAATAPDHRSMGLTEDPSAAPSSPPSTPAPPAATHRHAPATPAAQTPAVNAPRQQSLAPAPRTAQSAGHPHTAAAAPQPAAPAAAQPRSTAPSSSGTSTGTSSGTGAGTGTSTGTGSSGTASQPTSSTGTGSGTSTSPTSPTSPSSTSSHQLCLVLVCLG
ncbi:SCO2400 family protein [Streptomyces sp. NPDC054783]